MEASVKLGRIWGIPIGLHTSWFLVFALVTWSLAVGFFPMTYPDLSTPVYWLLGLVTSLLFFGSVLAHELGHSWVALREQIPVRSITLFIFGGVAQIGREPPSAGAEFRVAIAGPIVSLFLAAVFGGLFLISRAFPVLAAPAEYLGRINLILGVFNLIPGFPLDGGRVLRAIIWKLTDNYHNATRAATFMGQLVAFGFIALGIFFIFRGNFFNGLWIIFIGWFLQNAAASALAQSSILTALSGVKVNQVMSPIEGLDRAQVDGLTPLSTLVEERILTGGQRVFLVCDGGNLAGLLTLRDISAIPKDKWPYTTVRQVMTPVDKVAHFDPNTELMAAMRRMDDANINQAPVLESGRLTGLLSRDAIVHYLRTKTELGI